MMRPRHKRGLQIAMFCLHSHPLGRLGTIDTGGMSVYIRQTALELGKRGLGVDIFARFNGQYRETVIHLSETVRVIQVTAGEKRPLDRTALLSHRDEFIREVESFRKRADLDYDVIHCHYWLSGWAGRWARHHWAKPLVMTFHSVGAVKHKTANSADDNGFRLACEKKLMADCDLIVSLTTREKREIIRLFKGERPGKRISVIPCGVDLDIFVPTDKEKARHGLHLPDNKAVLLYVGRMDPLKGVDRLLYAAALLKPRLNFRLLIVGGDDPPKREERRLMAITQNLGIEDCVDFCGSLPQNELPVYYNAADLFVFPSRYESFGLAGLEALACGTPVVATRVGVYPQIMAHDWTGCLISGATSGDVAEAIEAILAKSRQAPDQADRIRKTINRYSWASVAESLCVEYNRLAGRRPTFNRTPEKPETRIQER